MSQPFVDVSVTNIGRSACTLSGYPDVVAVKGHAASGGKVHRLRARTKHSVYARPSRPSRVVLEPGGTAWFSLGTSTAEDGGRHQLRVTQVTVSLPGQPNDVVALHVELPASARAGRPVEVGVSGLRASRT